MKQIKTFAILLLATYNVHAQTQCPIIPKPLTAVVAKGTYHLPSTTPVVTEQQEIKNTADYLNKEISALHLPAETAGKQAIRLLITALKDKNPEAYVLQISKTGILIKGNAPEGVFNGAISLLQLIRQEGADLKCWTITDAPKYAWRGFMLDESRHFFGKEKVKSLLNWMAYYKLNRFHWHLTDEPAWRIQIDQYPKLTTVGGIGNYTDPQAPAQYYSKADIQEIVDYARQRFIEVIPEIDMPGHATAANKAYPEYSGGGSKGHPEFTFNPGKEATYTYLSNILHEVNQLFPYGMIHLGGDEVSYGNEKWHTDSSIQQLMQREHLSTLKDAELYFMRRMSDSVYSMHSKMLAWDEMAEISLPRDKTIIFWWRQDKPATLQMALQKGYTTVICPRLPLYFDFVQDSTHRHGRKWNKLYNSIQNVYAFSPEKYVPADADQSLIAGMQANLWTETIPSAERLDYLTFPRICALAEICWTPTARKNEADFMLRLKPQLELFKAAGLYYYDPFEPNVHAEPVPKKKTVSDYKD